MPSLWAAALSLAALLPAAQSTGPIHPVDVRRVVCDGQEGKVIIPMTAGQNRNEPHVLSFYRTSGERTEMEVHLEDANGKLAMDPVRLTLDSEVATQRRLGDDLSLRGDAPFGAGVAGGEQAASRWEPMTCEEFFLSDGRSPVELPDTWAEGRAAFHEMCLSEGLSGLQCEEAEEDAFQGTPRDGSPMVADADLCAKLLQSISAMDIVDVGDGRRIPMSELRTADGKPYELGRRLKGGGSTGSGGTAASGGFTSSGTAGRSFGYSTAGRSAAYGGAVPRTTGYGYAGASSYRRAMILPIAVGAGAGGFMFYRMRGGGSSRRGVDCGSAAAQECTRRCSVCELCKTDPANVAMEACLDADQAPCSECSAIVDCEGKETCYSSQCNPGEKCPLLLGENLTRDDLMNYAFIPQNFRYPLKLVINELNGTAFRSDVLSSMCPPTGFEACAESTCANSTVAPWLYTGPDLYVQLSQMEDFYWEEEFEEEESPIAFIVLLIIACCACCALRAVYNGCANRRGAEAYDNRPGPGASVYGAQGASKGGEKLQVRVPPGASPGTTLEFPTPKGMIQVQVPAGAREGSTFTVAY